MRIGSFFLFGALLGVGLLLFQRWNTQAAAVGDPPVEAASHAGPGRSVDGADDGRRAVTTSLSDPHPDRVSLADAGTRVLLDEILVRLDIIEMKLDAMDRRPVGVDVSGTSERELRSLVTAVLEEAAVIERIQEAEKDQRTIEEGIETRRKELRFQVGMMLAEARDVVGLDAGQREAVIDAVIEMEKKRQSFSEVDPATTDPEAFQREVEAVEEDFWLRLERDLGVELANKLREVF